MEIIKSFLKSKFPADWIALEAAYFADFPVWVEGWINSALGELEFILDESTTTLQKMIVAEVAALSLIESAISLYRAQVQKVDAGVKVEFTNKIKTLEHQIGLVLAGVDRKLLILAKQADSNDGNLIVKVL